MELLNMGIMIIAGGLIGLLATMVSDLKKRNKQLIEKMKCCTNCEMEDK